MIHPAAASRTSHLLRPALLRTVLFGPALLGSGRPRPRRFAAAAAASGAGVALLAGCAGADTAATSEGDAPGTSSTPPVTTTDTGGADYADGTYTATGSYATPESVETISVTLTVADDVVTAVSVSGDPQARESQQYQSQFIGGISDAVVGVDLDELSVTRVAGSSLTSGGFNEALAQIKTDAAA